LWTGAAFDRSWYLGVIDAAPPRSYTVMETGNPVSDFEWLMAKSQIVRTSWKTLLFGTIALTMLGFLGLLMWSAPSYSSRMILPISPTVRGLMQAGIVGEGVSVTGLAPSPLYSVTAIGRTPDQARAALEKGLDQIVVASKPVGQAREVIEHKIAALKDSTEAEARIKLIDLQNDLEGIRREDVLFQPTAAVSEPSRLARLAAIFFASFGAMALLILFRDEVNHHGFLGRQPRIHPN
jgi:hypothetical protein